MRQWFDSFLGYLCVTFLALYAPAVVVIPAWGEGGWHGYVLYPVIGLMVDVAVQTWSSVGEGTCFLALGILLGFTAVGSYVWHRGTNGLAPRSRLAVRLVLPVGVLALSFLQGAFAFMLIDGLNGVAHS